MKVVFLLSLVVSAAVAEIFFEDRFETGKSEIKRKMRLTVC